LAAVTLGASIAVFPERTPDTTEAAALIERDGAVILTGCGTTDVDAVAVARAIWGETLLAAGDPAAVREGGEGDQLSAPREQFLGLHADGFAYGDRAPDGVLLLCVEDAPVGGENFLADGYALLDVCDADLRAFLLSTAVDQTEPGSVHETVAPLVLTLASGRRMVRRPIFYAAGAEVAEYVERWVAMVREVGDSLPRFRLTPGDALVLDNYRVLHGRDPFEGERFMWRGWAWTNAGNGLPAGRLHSDSRYAVEMG
jgi:gamma-butyrobetaine dioxygenase